MIATLEQAPPAVVWAAVAWVVVLGVAGVAATDLSPWYYALRQPTWKPSDVLFGPVWTTIFVCAAAAAVLASAVPDATSASRFRLAAAYAVNGACNVGWSVLFFRRRRPDLALVESAALWLSVVAMAVTVAMTAPAAALLLVPYLAWVSFAIVLNRWIVRANGPFGAAATEGAA
ncbi:MAG: TspO/MBR family protein [Gemmatimonadales bacterium]|nr:TspO/MBR family protein [Gemmatimonadales bacterium]